MASSCETCEQQESESINKNGNLSDAKDFKEPLKLKKQLGLMNGVGIIVGIIIGSGIFVSPRGVLQSSGSVGSSLIIWVLCGLMSLSGALCYAELGTSIPLSGGDYAYLQTAFGDLFAFLYLWVALLIIMPTGNAIIALTFSEYIIQPFLAECSPPYFATRLLAALIILLLTFVNCCSVKWATKIQDTFACAKLIALAIIIGAGCVYMSLGYTQNFNKPFEDSTTNIGSLALAFYSGMFSFSGWNSLNFVTEELKNPNRNLPRAIYISLPLVTLVYFLTNVAYFAVLTHEEILASSTVAGTFGDKILGVMSWTMPIFVALSTFGGLNGSIFASSRLFFVGARKGHLPDSVAMIHINYLTPAPSLIFLCIMTVVYLWAGHIFVLINFTSFIESIFLTLTTGGLIWLRIKEPLRKRPIKVNIILPTAFLCIGILLIILPFYERPVETGIGLLITISGIPAYFVFIYWKNKPQFILKSSEFFTKFIQKLLLCSPQERRKSCEEESREIDEYFDKIASNNSLSEIN